MPTPQTATRASRSPRPALNKQSVSFALAGASCGLWCGRAVGGCRGYARQNGVSDPLGGVGAQSAPTNNAQAITFSAEATEVFNAGRALWRYYMAQPKANPNASYYDIRAHFQGFSEKNGKRKMNPSSTDPTYTELLASLRSDMQRLAQKIRPKVYAHGFLAV